MTSLEALLKPKAPEYQRYILEITGKPKTSKSTLALTASRHCPPPAQWDPKKPVSLQDLLIITFEPNAVMYANSRGIETPYVLDWSDEGLGIGDLEPAIKALPAMAEQYRAAGVTTVIIDTLSAFNRMLLRDIIERPTYDKDMDRIRAYGRVDEKHYLLFDSLRAMKLNIIGIMHVNAFQPFGEEGGNTQMAQAMAKQAAKQVDKVEVGAIAGARTDFIADCRPKVAAHWARLADAVLAAQPQEVTVRAGEKQMKYNFCAQPGGELSAGGRWDLPAINDGFLRPHIEKRYPKA